MTEIGVETIAEGIETADQLQRLRDLGCDIGQGFYFSPALDREDLIERLNATGVFAPGRLKRATEWRVSCAFS